MSQATNDSLLSRQISTVWNQTIDQIPNLFGRLVYLSTLRDPQTARYIHHGLAARFGEDAAETAILESHREVFHDWLSQQLPDQRQLLEEYLSGLPDPRADVVAAWLSVAYYRAWMPVGTPMHEQQLYLTDIKALLSLLRNEYGPASDHPVSLPTP